MIGIGIGILAVGNLALDAGKLIYVWREPIIQVATGKAGLDTLWGKPDLFKSEMFLAFDKGNGNIVTYRVAFHGSNDLTADLEEMNTRTKGVMRGHLRAGGLTFEFASKDPNRPGYGSLVLRPYVSAAESDAPIYAGIATFHDCQCLDGSVKQNGPIMTTQVVLSANPTLPNHLKVRFFGKGPQKAPALFPEDVQKLAATNPDDQREEPAWL